MNLPVLIIGAGSHGRVVADLVVARGSVLKGFLDQDKALHGKSVDGHAVLGGDECLEAISPAQVTLALGIGAVDSLAPRTKIFTQFSRAGYVFEALIHPRAIVAKSARIAAGAQVMAAAVVQAGAQVAENVIINTAAVIDHDCEIGAHSHVAPGAILCGTVRIGEGCYVGAGATIIQGVRIGAGAFIAAGAVVIADVADGARMAGRPSQNDEFTMKKWQSVIIQKTASIRDALAVINDARSAFAMVVEGRNHLLGTLSDGDIRRALLGGAALESPVEPWMSRTPFVAPDSASVDDILRMMRARGLHQVPIVDVEGCVIGLKTIDDFLQVPKRDTPVVIMAGGLGTRLNELTRENPKPMLPIGNQPMLEMVVNRFVLQGFTDIWLAVNYRADIIESYFGDGAKFGAQIRYLKESKRLGTAGAVSLLPQDISEPVIVSNADVITSVDYAGLVDTHNANDAAATMAVREQEFAIPFGVIVEAEGRLMRIEEKPVHRLVVNAGIYVLSPDAVRTVPVDTYYDMPQLFDALIADGKPVFCERLHGYWLDVGQRADYDAANADAAGRRSPNKTGSV